MVRALASHARGRRFESYCPYHYRKGKSRSMILGLFFYCEQRGRQKEFFRIARVQKFVLNVQKGQNRKSVYIFLENCLNIFHELDGVAAL